MWGLRCRVRRAARKEGNRKREEIRGRVGDGVELEGREESRGEAKV